MGIFLRCAGGLLLVVLYSLTHPVDAAQYYYSASCSFASCQDVVVYGHSADQACSLIQDGDHAIDSGTGGRCVTAANSLAGRWARKQCTDDQHIVEDSAGWYCADEPPEPECPAWGEASFNVDGNHQDNMCVDDCEYQPRFWGADFTRYDSTGETCESDPGDGGDDGGDEECDPETEDCDGGGDDGGDDGGECDPETEDCSGDGGGGDDGGGDDGGGSPGGGDGDGDGDGDCDPETEECGDGGGYGAGVCDRDNREEPECESDLDVVQCGIFIEQWNTRCDAQIAHEDIIGTPEYRSGPSITDEGAGDIPTATFDAQSVISGLSEDTISFGNLQCPSDRTFSMPSPLSGSFTLSWEPICDWAAMVKPFIIALGYFASAMIILRKFSGSGSDD